MPRHDWRALALLGTVIVGALVAGGYWVWTRPEPAEPAANTPAPVVPDVIAPGAVTPGTTQAPAPPHSETPVVAPQPAPAPPSATAAAPPAGPSAVEILDRKFQENLKKEARPPRKVVESEKFPTRPSRPSKPVQRKHLKKSPPKQPEPETEWTLMPTPTPTPPPPTEAELAEKIFCQPVEEEVSRAECLSYGNMIASLEHGVAAFNPP